MFLLLLWATLATSVSGSRVTFREVPSNLEFSGQLIAMPKAGQEGLAEALSATLLLRRLPSTGELVLEVPKGETENSLAQNLMDTGLFAYVEPNWRCFPCSVPNDPLINQQWNLFQTSAPGAWDDSIGAGVTIAVTDSGVDLTHPDLQNRVSGFNAVSDLPESLGGAVSDVHTSGHGTQVSGLACATGNNAIGIAGAAYGALLMPIRVSNAANGNALLTDIKQGIEWAADNGAKVINTSYTGVNNQSVQTTGLYCWQRGAISVWAIGNLNLDSDQMTSGSPAARWDHANVIVVGATKRDDTKATFSNYGRAVDFMAPGVGVVTTEKGGGYTATPSSLDGTSYAAPLVAGALALSISANPGFSLERHARRLELGCYDIGGRPRPGEAGYSYSSYLPGNDLRNGWGRINMDKLLNPAIPKYDVVSIPLQVGATASRATGVNDLGDVVGYYEYLDGSTRPFLYSGGVVTIIPRLVRKWGGAEDTTTTAVDINNSGQVLLDGYDRAARWSVASGLEYLDVQPSFEDPTSLVVAKDINNLGNSIAEVLFNNGASGSLEQVWFGTNPLSLIPVDENGELIDRNPISEYPFAINDANEFLTRLGPYPTFRGRIYRIEAIDELMIARQIYLGPERYAFRDLKNSGFRSGVYFGSQIVGTHGWPDGSLMTFSVGVFTDFYGANEHEVSVGVANPPNDIAVVHYGYEGGFTLISRVENLNTWTAFVDGGSINNLGQIVGAGRRLGSSALKAYVTQPISGINLNVDLGTIGSNPIYLGAIPPAVCVVQFLREDGSEYPNARRVLEYSSSSGALTENDAPVVLPSSVTGNFRILFRLTNTSVPEWNDGDWLGCGYLGRIYPPMSQPGLPNETNVIPMVELTLGDIDCDNEIAIGDYALLSTEYGTSGATPADINGDSEVDIADYAILSSNYGLIGD